MKGIIGAILIIILASALVLITASAPNPGETSLSSPILAINSSAGKQANNALFQDSNLPKLGVKNNSTSDTNIKNNSPSDTNIVVVNNPSQGIVNNPAQAHSGGAFQSGGSASSSGDGGGGEVQSQVSTVKPLVDTITSNTSSAEVSENDFSSGYNLYYNPEVDIFSGVEIPFNCLTEANLEVSAYSHLAECAENDGKSTDNLDCTPSDLPEYAWMVAINPSNYSECQSMVDASPTSDTYLVPKLPHCDAGLPWPTFMDSVKTIYKDGNSTIDVWKYSKCNASGALYHNLPKEYNPVHCVKGSEAGTSYGEIFSGMSIPCTQPNQAGTICKDNLDEFGAPKGPALCLTPSCRQITKDGVNFVQLLVIQTPPQIIQQKRANEGCAPATGKVLPKDILLNQCSFVNNYYDIVRTTQSCGGNYAVCVQSNVGGAAEGMCSRTCDPGAQNSCGDDYLRGKGLNICTQNKSGIWVCQSSTALTLNSDIPSSINPSGGMLNWGAPSLAAAASTQNISDQSAQTISSVSQKSLTSESPQYMVFGTPNLMTRFTAYAKTFDTNIPLNEGYSFYMINAVKDIECTSDSNCVVADDNKTGTCTNNFCDMNILI